MVEVPAAALLADRILADADFASIGTNDLTQYTLAADRLLGSVASFQDPWHPAVLRLVGEVGRAGAALGKPVGICGEAAADPMLAVVLVGLGATSLSMSPAALADVRAELSRFTKHQAIEFAELALSANSAVEARAAVLSAASPITTNHTEIGVAMTTSSVLAQAPAGSSRGRVRRAEIRHILSAAWSCRTSPPSSRGASSRPSSSRPDGCRLFHYDPVLGAAARWLEHRPEGGRTRASSARSSPTCCRCSSRTPGGRMVYGLRGGVIGVIATMGVIVGARASRCSSAP